MTGKALYDRLEPVFATAHTGCVPVKIDDVAEGVKKIWNMTETVTDIEYHPTPHFEMVAGALEKVKISIDLQHDRFVGHIYYKEHANYCWERFSKAKELCQIILDKKETRISKFNPTKNFIRRIVAPFIQQVNSGDVDEAVVYDHFGIIAACELLFPMRERHYFFERMDDDYVRKQVLAIIQAQDLYDQDQWDGAGPREDFDENGPLTALLAYAYRIPKTYVDTLLVDDTMHELWQWGRNENPTRFASIEHKRKK